MEDLVAKIILAVGSLIIGNLATKWWDRARPLNVLVKFTDVTKGSDPADCDKELHELTKQSFSAPAISVGEVKFVEIEKAYNAAKHDLLLTENIDKWVADSLATLNSAKTEQEKIEAIKSIFRWTGLRTFVEFMFYRSLASDLKPTFDYQGNPKLLIVPSDENEGSLRVVFPESLGRLGGNFSKDKWRVKAIEPLVRAIEHLDVDFLAQLTGRIPNIAIRQREIDRQIVEKTSPIRDNHTLWVAHCTLVNYGNSPLIVWPDGELEVIAKANSKSFLIPCYLALTKDSDSSDASDLVGPLVVGVGQTVKIWVITKNTKAKMPDGNVINAYFKDKSATARTFLVLSQRGIPFKTKCKSTRLPFARSD